MGKREQTANAQGAETRGGGIHLFEAAILGSIIVLLGLRLLFLLLLLLVLLLFLLLLLLSGLGGTSPANSFFSLLQISQGHTLKERVIIIISSSSSSAVQNAGTVDLFAQ